MVKKIINYFNLLFVLIYKKRYLSKIKSQNKNQESLFLQSLLNKISNKSFIEFGFHPFEFNNIHLMTLNCKGILVDGNIRNTFFMKLLTFFHRYKIKVINLFLDRENVINIVKENFGIFSIDIDGNDYWIIKEILKYNDNFEIIIVEYNSSFLDKSVTTPYDVNFNRHAKHSSGWYAGASLKAFIKLLDKKDYTLVKTIGGNNAFFVKKKLLDHFNLKELSFEKGFEECELRNYWSKKNAKEQFDVIKHLELIEV
jgi:hypothetical protein